MRTFAAQQLSFDENATSAWPVPGELWCTIFKHLCGECWLQALLLACAPQLKHLVLQT